MNIDINSKDFQEIVNDFKNNHLDIALNKLKKLSINYPDEYLVIKLFASIYFKKLDWKNAIKSYEKLILFEKEKFKTHNDIGVAYFKLGKINKSIKEFKKSIMDNPNIGGYCNLGIAYNEIGNYEEAVNNYLAALKLDNNNFLVKKYLISTFELYKPSKINNNPILKINDEISQICTDYESNDLYNLNNIKKILSKSNEIIKVSDINLSYNETQIFRRNSQDLNCNRHFKIFNKFDIIPKYCFACYKVQINVLNVVDLIKLYFVFDNLFLKKNNIRKCIIEMRENIKGNYKGYIYCNGLIEAKAILKKINLIMNDIEFKYFKIEIKHGCSEFYESYPAYKNINFNGEQEMKYNQQWIEKENIIDKQYSIRDDRDRKILGQSLNGINLSDILIIKNWLIFANIIGDQSYKLIFDEKIENNFIEKILQSQLSFRKKELT